MELIQIRKTSLVEHRYMSLFKIRDMKLHKYYLLIEPILGV